MNVVLGTLPLLETSYYEDHKDVMYEGWQHVPLTYHNTIFAGTPLFDLFEKTLGINQNPLMPSVEYDIAYYRPRQHTQQLQTVGVLSDADAEPLLHNECIDLYLRLHNTVMGYKKF